METLAKQKANQPDGVTVSTTVLFVTDSGGDEDTTKHIARDASTPNVLLLFLLFALPCLLHLLPLHRETLAGVRGPFVRDLVLKDGTLGMKCWNTIGKTTDCWRDRHKAVYTEWVQAFGVVEADTYAKKCRNSGSAGAGGEYRRQRGEGVSRATHQP